jgi:hypothetical protein
LAGHLGCTVEELLSRISAAELAEWQAYYAIEPFGETWKQTSYLCAMVGNGAGGKKGGGNFKPDDFMPVRLSRRLRARRQRPDEMLNVFRMLAGRGS